MRRPEATFTHDAPSAAAVKAIGLLRRPASLEDRVEEKALEYLPAEDVYIDCARAAHTAGGRSLLVVVARNTNLAQPEPARCLDATHARLLQLLAHQSRRVSSTALKIFGQLRFGREHESTVPHEGVFVFDHSAADVGGGGGGGSLEDFMKRGAFISSGDETRSVLTGIVPDGVARIEVEYPRRVSRGRYYKPVVPDFRSWRARARACWGVIASRGAGLRRL